MIWFWLCILCNVILYDSSDFTWGYVLKDSSTNSILKCNYLIGGPKVKFANYGLPKLATSGNYLYSITINM